jgi:hypothetical protein
MRAAFLCLDLCRLSSIQLGPFQSTIWLTRYDREPGVAAKLANHVRPALAIRDNMLVSAREGFPGLAPGTPKTLAHSSLGEVGKKTSDAQDLKMHFLFPTNLGRPAVTSRSCSQQLDLNIKFWMRAISQLRILYIHIHVREKLAASHTNMGGVSNIQHWHIDH